MRRPSSLRAGGVLAGSALALALLAPLLASEAPYLARVDGRLCAPILERSSLFRWAGCGAGTPRDWRDLRRRQTGGIVLDAPIPFSPEAADLETILQPPGRVHYLGTDSLGRDVAARVLLGFPVALLIAGLATLLSLGVGTLLGSMAGASGGWLDLAIQRLVDLMSCFPTLILAMALAAAARRPGLASLVLAIGLTRWTGIARLLRAEVVRQQVQAYCDAAKAVGVSRVRLLVRHLLPNALAPVLVTAAFSLSQALLLEAGLSFLGVGVAPGTASWGGILAEAQRLVTPAWWMVLFPSAALFLTVLGCNLTAEGMREWFDPRAPRPATEASALLRDAILPRLLGPVKGRVGERQ
ncbi:MAG TPA: ABC transporter permease [Candidatus Polarisedimenticolia bacterium]|nr:ABC transporter permease [Candidatus Polarisedimenticolia bacterium]